MKDYIIKIFLGTFILAFISSAIAWGNLYYLDFQMWVDQVKYVDHNDEKQYNFAEAYAHPGGTVVLGSLIIKKVFNTFYGNSLFYFLTISFAFFVALCAVLLYLLFGNNFWWIASLPPLIFNRIYPFATPPSFLASVVFVFIFLLVLYIFKNKEKNMQFFGILWSLFLGFLFATRLDLGIVAFVFSLFPLSRVFRFKKLVYFGFLIFVSFVVFNPFMWFMPPIEHLGDLIYKILFHYDGYGQIPFPLINILRVSLLPLISVFVFIVCYLTSKKEIKYFYLKTILPFLLLSILLYCVFFSADYKAERYFLPFMLIWEMLLPLFIFQLLPNFTERIKKFNLKIKKDKTDYFYLSVFLMFLTYPILSFIFEMIKP